MKRKSTHSSTDNRNHRKKRLRKLPFYALLAFACIISLALSLIPALRVLNREVKLIFDRRGIVIPYNQIVVHESGNDPAR